MQGTEDAEPRHDDADLWKAPVREPLLGEAAGVPRSRGAVRVTIAVLALLSIAFLGYEAFGPSPDDRLAWTPPPGLQAEQTPPWLQTLCAEATRELCTAADRARTASDCEAMRAALRSLAAIERKLTGRGAVSQRQHWVLVELYGQGHELCQFELGQGEAGTARDL